MKAATLIGGKSLKQSVPFYVPLLNPLVKGLLHLGMPMGPMALLSVRGRKTGRQHTTPVAIIEIDRNRYVTSVYGISQWVRNLRAAGEAKLAQGWHSENVMVVELSPEKAAPVLREGLRMAPSFLRKYFDTTRASPLEDFERDALHHPVFLLKKSEPFPTTL